MVIFFIILAYAISSALGMVLMKSGGGETRISRKKNGVIVDLDYRLILGTILYFLSFAFWIIILGAFPVVYISPIVYGVNFLFIVMFSYLFLKEKITTRGILGAIIIIIGVVIASV
ncbi:putative Spermidine export protein MdtJ [Clostridium neonatale]|uniref:EamA family transporter n=1 Tax=Clostridium neonatale TaxID=137838 RepID=UPI00291C141E|nr:EamA family transporter [Clostridium neonatale]CAI3633387.1 putative Spermidine export protein MdtJ [Clostridium neonatale]